MSDTMDTPNAFYSEYRPTIWNRLGFKRAHVLAPNWDDEIEGFAPGSIRTNVVAVLDWKDRLRILITGKMDIAIATMTSVEVPHARSVSAISILPPGDHQP